MYTKGEWKYYKKDYPEFLGHKMESRYIVKGLTVIAEMGGGTKEEAKANAHLIAAAPDMYEALRSGVEGIRLNPRGKERDLAIRAFMFLAEKALAKAEGK